MPFEHCFAENGLRFEYFDESAFRDAYEEVFGEAVYRFIPRGDSPFILDAGANLGLATCYFKKCFPQAEVVAFEPDPRMQELFRRNMKANGFTNVRLECCALAGTPGRARLHGDLASETPHALGNSLRAGWGLQQPTSSGIDVETRTLSPFLDRPVDLLKLDIEGAELEVLREAEGRLQAVREIRMEIHETAEQPGMCREICDLLRAAGFRLEVKERPLHPLLPVEAHPWFDRASPRLFILEARHLD
jgi:FkbM family methyltransferase